MGKNVSRKNNSSRKVKKYIVIFGEGKRTEPTYINKLKPFKKDYDLYPTILKNEGIGENCEKWFDDCKKAYNGSVSKTDSTQIESIWFVFDFDGRLSTNKVINFIKGKTFEKKTSYLAFSSMCIEYWILLHFCNHNGSHIYQNCDTSHSARIITMINDEIDKCNKSRKFKLSPYSKSNEWLDKNFDFFLEDNLANPLNFLEPKPRIVEAFVRAKKIHENKIAKGNEFAESVTTFYQLLEYLGVVYYKDVYKDTTDSNIYDVVNNCYKKNGKKIIISDVHNIKNEPYFNR